MFSIMDPLDMVKHERRVENSDNSGATTDTNESSVNFRQLQEQMESLTESLKAVKFQLDLLPENDTPLENRTVRSRRITSAARDDS